MRLTKHLPSEQPPLCRLPEAMPSLVSAVVQSVTIACCAAARGHGLLVLNATASHDRTEIAIAWRALVAS